MPRLEALEVVPDYALRIRCDPAWRLAPDWARNLHDYDLWYVWAGRGRMITRGGPIELRPGVGVWTRPGGRYEAEHDPRNPLGVSAMHFRLRWRGRILPISRYIPPFEVFQATHPDYFESTLSHAVMMARKSPALAALLLKALLIEAAADAAQQSTEGGTHRHYRERVEPLMTLIRDNPAAAHRVAEMARKTGYSPDHFARVFRQVTGWTPKEFIVRARLDRAVALLHTSSQTIAQISESLGYQDISFFSRQFKKQFGMGPSRFRRKEGS